MLTLLIRPALIRYFGGWLLHRISAYTRGRRIFVIYVKGAHVFQYLSPIIRLLGSCIM